MGITVYLKTVCPGCDTLLRSLLSKGVTDFEFVNVEANTDAFDKVMALGYKAAPVVVSEDGDHWTGFRPDKIEQIIKDRLDAGYELVPIPLETANKMIKDIKAMSLESGAVMTLDLVGAH